MIELEKRVREVMLKEHNTALGIFGIPEGSYGTFSNREFYQLALDRGAITDPEFKELKRYIGEFSWYRDLSD